ncbi:MAG TPA: hypothetical protein VHE37_01055, partial [Nevskiaceae bacterium]|nr:hypothetical protein [Nevskiaceae bacterium]
MNSTRRSIAASAALCVLLAACNAGTDVTGAGTAVATKADLKDVFEGPVPRAACGAGSLPETDIQGRVSIDDRNSGRSLLGYSCNLQLLGQYQGQGTTWVSASYRHCAYHGQTVTSIASSTPGVNVVDVSDPAHPVLSERLTSPAFLGNTWETLKVNEARGLLGGVMVGPILGAAFFDVYDISGDCAHPVLLNSVGESQLTLPANTLGHEGNWSPDGKTYWSSAVVGGVITAIDVSDPAHPSIVYTGSTGLANHGFEISADGNRLYIAEAGAQGVLPNGLHIYDISEIQQRKPLPQMRLLGSVTWTDGQLGQHAVPVSWNGRPYLIFVDEQASGAARIIDIADETAPRVVSKLKLEIHMPENAALRSTDTQGNGV